MSNYKLVDMPMELKRNELPCDGCVYIRVGRQRNGFQDSKSRTCVANVEAAAECEISEKGRKIWVAK